MKSSYFYFLRIIALLFLQAPVTCYSQEEYEMVSTSSWTWSDNSQLMWYSSSISQLDVFYNQAETEENIKNNTWSSETTWLKIPVIKGKAYTITFNVKNEHNPKGYKYKVIGKDKNGKSIEVWHDKNIYWGLTFKANYYTGGETDFEIDYSNRKEMNSDYTYTSYYSTITGKWKSCQDIPTQTIKIEYDGNQTVNIYDRHGDNMIKSFYGIYGITWIGVKCGNAARIVVSNLKMRRQTDFGAALPEILNASEMIDNRNYSSAVSKLTRILNSYRGPLPYYYRARAYIGQEYYKSAIEDCNSALQYQCDMELKNNIYFLRGFSKLLLNDDTGVTDMRQAGTLGMTFLRENNLLDYVPGKTRKSSSPNRIRNTKNGTNNRTSSRIPTLKKTK